MPLKKQFNLTWFAQHCVGLGPGLEARRSEGDQQVNESFKETGRRMHQGGAVGVGGLIKGRGAGRHSKISTVLLLQFSRSPALHLLCSRPLEELNTFSCDLILVQI